MLGPNAPPRYLFPKKKERQLDLQMKFIRAVVRRCNMKLGNISARMTPQRSDQFFSVLFWVSLVGLFTGLILLLMTVLDG
jgi:hypothetical protein